VCIVVLLLCVLLYNSCVYCCTSVVCIVVLVLCVLYLYRVYCSFLVCIVVVVLCIFLLSYVYLLHYVCIAVFTLDAGLQARSQYSEGPATGHLDTGFSWFLCA